MMKLHIKELKMIMMMRSFIKLPLNVSKEVPYKQMNKTCSNLTYKEKHLKKLQHNLHLKKNEEEDENIKLIATSIAFRIYSKFGVL